MSTLLSVQKQREYFQPGSWHTILEITGAGTIKNLVLDFDTQSIGVAPREIQMRIRANGAATAQVGGGVDGLQLQNIFGPGVNSATVFRTETMGVTANSSTWWGSFWKRDIPFQDGIQIELYLPGSPGIDDAHKVKSWAMAEYILEAPSYVLHGDYFRTDVVPNAEATLLETTTWTRLLGLWHRMTPLSGPSPADWRFLEGDFRIYYGGDVAPLYRANGTEDFYGSSHYFNAGLYQREEVGVTVFNAVNGQCVCYRFFDSVDLIAEDGLKLTWCNGESDVASPTYSVRSGCTLFYYQ